MERTFEYRAYGKRFKLTAQQLDKAFDIAMSLMLLRRGV